MGSVRALDDRGKQIKEDIGTTCRSLGLARTGCGDHFTFVGNEAKLADCRLPSAQKKEKRLLLLGTSFEQLLLNRDNKKDLPVIIKADVHGSVEAIAGSLAKIAEDSAEVAVRVLHTGVGAITESDVTLARASGAYLVGFNVRANAQAREMAKRDKVELRYYNIIYNIIDDVKAMLGGMLSPIR